MRCVTLRPIRWPVLAATIVSIAQLCTGPSADRRASRTPCGSTFSGDDESVSVRDSAGIEVVESADSEEAAGERFRLVHPPARTIGAVDGPESHEFGWIGAVRRVPSGHIAVAEVQASEIRVFDSSGRFVHRFGGRGDGPGEFRGLENLFIVGEDGAFLYALGAGQLNRFTLEGAFLESRSVVGFDLPASWDRIPIRRNSNLVLLGPFRDGSFLTRVYLDAEEDGDALGVLVFDARRGDARHVGTFPAADAGWYGDSEGSRFYGLLPFGKVPSFAVGPESFWYTSGGAYEVSEFSKEGDLRRIVRLCRRAPSVTEDDKEKYGRAQLAGIPEEDRPQSGTDPLQLPYPETKPAYGQLILDDTGRLWARLSALDGQPATWHVYGERDGRLLGSAVTPAGFTVFEIGAGQVLGRALDAMDVHMVRSYRLEEVTR